MTKRSYKPSNGGHRPVAPVEPSEIKGRIVRDADGRIVIVYSPFCAAPLCVLTATDRSRFCWVHTKGKSGHEAQAPF